MSEGDQNDETLLAAGSRVEVRTAFDGSWSRGFTVVEVRDGRYRLRRRSDATELPTTFAPQDVRAEVKRSMWWI